MHTLLHPGNCLHWLCWGSWSSCQKVKRLNRVGKRACNFYKIICLPRKTVFLEAEESLALQSWSLPHDQVESPFLSQLHSKRPQAAARALAPFTGPGCSCLPPPAEAAPTWPFWRASLCALLGLLMTSFLTLCPCSSSYYSNWGITWTPKRHTFSVVSLMSFLDTCTHVSTITIQTFSIPQETSPMQLPIQYCDLSHP